MIELWVPPLRRIPPGGSAVPMSVDDRHLVFDTYDVVSQQGTSHHYCRGSGDSVGYGSSDFRYIWPSECDLMARLAGLEFESRFAGWNRIPFTAKSQSHVSVWRKPA